MLKENVQGALYPILEAHEYVATFGLDHERLFLGLSRMVTSDLAAVITIFHARKGKREMTHAEFVGYLDRFIPSTFLDDLLLIAHISWGVDYIAVTPSHSAAHAALRGTLGDSVAVTLIALDACSRRHLRDAENLAIYLIANVPHDSLWAFFEKNTGKLHAENVVSLYLTALSKVSKIDA